MWILDALSEIPFQKPFVTLSVALGAVFLLLAHYFQLNPLLEPISYTAVALTLYFLTPLPRPYRAMLFIPGSYALALWLLNSYAALFCLAFALTAGLTLYRNLFRWWRWLASSALLFVSILMAASWQHLLGSVGVIPSYLSPVVLSTVFAFAILCSLAPFQLRKNSVSQAMELLPGEPQSEPYRMAVQVEELYSSLRRQVPDREALEDFCERVVLLCRQLQQIRKETSRIDLLALVRQIEELKKKATEAEDAVAKRQYEQALHNKEKQKSQFDSLKMQEERIRAQVLNYLSALENLQFAFSNAQFRTSEDASEAVDFFLHLASVRAENAWDTAEAYQKLRAET